jgi:hypothetical protein
VDDLSVGPAQAPGWASRQLVGPDAEGTISPRVSAESEQARQGRPARQVLELTIGQSRWQLPEGDPVLESVRSS